VNDTPARFQKLLLPVVALALIVGIGAWFLKPSDEVVSTPEKAAPTPAKRKTPHPKHPTAKDVSDASVSKRAFADYGLKSKTTVDDLKLVDGLIRNFYLIAKDHSDRFPMGTNREITRVLAGHNPMKRAWIAADHPAIDERGELNDRWNNPLHFHALARGVFEIRSAGPDGEVFTEDDFVRGKKRVATQTANRVADDEATQRPEEI
jgi:hypothetical protein